MLINDYTEISIDGMIGPSHCFLGLSHGNKASMAHQYQFSSPRKACLEGLKKMSYISSLGVPQYILPPHPRPVLLEDETIESLINYSNTELYSRLSASSMWMANAAHISSSLNSSDGNVHVTPANLKATQHRSYEPPIHQLLLKELFPFAVHHDPISIYQDEGAANDVLLSPNFNSPSIHLFFYGKDERTDTSSHTFPRRQDKEAYTQLIDDHRLTPNHVYLIQQHDTAIEAGVFHNDVISTGTANVFLYHDFTCNSEHIEEISKLYNDLYHEPLYMIKVSNDMLPLDIAVKSYLFNSQLISLSSNEMILVAPEDCLLFNESLNTIRSIIDSDNPIKRVHFINLNQSMMNGGGPACLRLRCQLNSNERNEIPNSFLFTNELYQKLILFVNRYYPKKLSVYDFKNLSFLQEIESIYSEIYDLFDLSLRDLSKSIK